MYGYTVEEMGGRPISDVFAPEFQAEAERHLQTDDDVGHRVHETWHVRKDGRRFPVLLDVHSVRDGDGALRYRVIYIQDTTERQELLTSLRETEQERAYVMSAARCLLWHADVSESGHPKYLSWELQIPDADAAQRFLPFDLQPGEMYRDGWYRCRDPIERDVNDVLGTAAIRAGQSYEQEFRCFCADGSIRWLHEAIRVETLESGKQWRLVGVCTDISERKRAEQASLDKQASIEKLNARLRQAMTETHHRVKNNLQMISALIDMRVMEATETVPVEEMHRLSAQIQSLAIVHDVLTGATREADNTLCVSARRMLAALLPKLRDMGGEQGLTYHLDDAALTTQQSTALALIMQELHANALKHGGREVTIRLSVSGPQATLEARDMGKGFAPDFDPAAAANTGLELVLTLTRTDLNGQASFTTLPEGGGRVAITFPLTA